MKNLMLAAALKYAGLGLPVFPLHHIQGDGSCSCAAGSLCESAGKHPLFSGWQQSATTDRDAITQWWSQHPNANIGIPTGKASGWLALDSDPRHGGDKSLVALEKKHGSLSATVTAHTGSGGQHYLFQMPEGVLIPNRTGFVPGLDIRADGGYIVATPSNHKSGQRYAWPEGRSPAECLAPFLRVFILIFEVFFDKINKQNQTERRRTLMQKKALVIIDIQNDITKNYKGIIDNINKAIDWAVSNDIHVVCIRHENLSEGTRTFKPNTRGAELVNVLM